MIRHDQEAKKKKLSPGKVLGVILALLIIEPELWEVLGVLLAIALVLAPIAIPLYIYFRRKKHREKHQSVLQNTTFTPCAREKAFDEQSRKLFCFHDDKAIHHVGRGKEIDPWDRPDIDISKYQRR